MTGHSETGWPSCKFWKIDSETKVVGKSHSYTASENVLVAPGYGTIFSSYFILLPLAWGLPFSGLRNGFFSSQSDSFDFLIISVRLVIRKSTESNTSKVYELTQISCKFIFKKEFMDSSSFETGTVRMPSGHANLWANGLLQCTLVEKHRFWIKDYLLILYAMAAAVVVYYVLA